MQGTKNLTQGPINKLLFKLAMPIMATSFIQMAYSLTDMAWLGRLGSEAVAAAGAVGMLMWLSTCIALLNKVGAEVSVGQSIGAKDQTSAQNFASHNITISLLISIVWGSVLFFFADTIIDLYELETAIAADAVDYLHIVASALPFVFLSFAFTGIYNGAGRSTIPFYVSGAGLVINMILDPLLIFGFDFGVKGAAYATLTSQLIVCIIFIYKIKKRDVLLGGFKFLTKLKFDYTKRILKLGVPVAVLNMMFAFVNIFLCRMASEQGGHIGLMTFTTGGQIEAITWNTTQGFSTGLSSFVAQNYAAKEIKRVLKAWYFTLRMAGIFGILCTLLFVFFGNEIFAIFVPEREAYIAGGTFLRIDGYSQLFMTLEIAMQGMFYGMGRTVPPAVSSSIWNFMRIPLSFLLIALGFGVNGIWWAVCISTFFKGTTLLTWFIATKKKYFKLA